MSKNYFSKLINYVKSVYQIDEDLNKLTDKRVNPTFKTGRSLLAVLAGFFLRITSFNELNFMLKNNELKNLIPKGEKFPLIDSIRDTLKVIDVNGLRRMNTNIINKSIRNKVFQKGTIDGYVVAAIDGTKIFGSDKKECNKCLTTKKKNGTINHFHSAVVMSTVGDGPNLVLDFEMYDTKVDSVKKDEGEITTAKRMLTRFLTSHKNFVDVFVYDALAFNAPLINHCLELGTYVVIRVKKNKNNALKRVWQHNRAASYACDQVKKIVNAKKETTEEWEDEKGNSIKAYEEKFLMKGVSRELRYIKFAKIEMDDEGNKTRSQLLVVTADLEMKIKTAYKIMKSRWQIENSIFHNLKTKASIGHYFVHGGNAVEAVLSCMFIASNLFQLFKVRRIKDHVTSQRELVRLLVKGLYLSKYDRKLVFSSG